VILEEEENLISTHRSHIDQVVDIVKQDMSLLQQVDQPSSDIEAYVTSLDQILVKQIEKFGELRQ